MSKSSFFITLSCLFISGIWSGLTFNAPEYVNEYTEWVDQKTAIEGQIISDIEKRNPGQRFKLAVPGYSQILQVHTLSWYRFNYGDKVLVVGKIKQPNNISDHFDYVNYLRSKNIYATISYADVFVLEHNKRSFVFYYGLKIKHWLFERFNKNLPKESAALMIALLTGQKDFLPKETVEAFSKTGTAHIIAVSGFVVTLIMLSMYRYSMLVGNFLATTLILGSSLLYLIMADFAPGIIRAALMSFLFMAYKYFKKDYDLLPSLVFTALLLVIYNPMLVKYDLGFMLSFLSLLGIYLFTPIFSKILYFLPNKFAIREIVAGTIAAQIATAPITAYYFDQFSVIAPLANLSILILIPPILTLGYLCVIPYFGYLFSVLANIPLVYILWSVKLMASWKWASITISITPLQMTLIYVFELSMYLALNKVLKKNKSAGTI